MTESKHHSLMVQRKLSEVFDPITIDIPYSVFQNFVACIHEIAYDYDHCLIDKSVIEMNEKVSKLFIETLKDRITYFVDNMDYDAFDLDDTDIYKIFKTEIDEHRDNLERERHARELQRLLELEERKEKERLAKEEEAKNGVAIMVKAKHQAKARKILAAAGLI